MKSVITLLGVISLAIAAPQYTPFRTTPPQLLVPKPVVVQPQLRVASISDDSKNAVILRYDSDNIGAGSYSYAVETSDGQSKSEEGQLINVGTDNESIAVRGQYSYTGPDGVLYTVTYIADENGFQPQGAHIPQR